MKKVLTVVGKIISFGLAVVLGVALLLFVIALGITALIAAVPEAIFGTYRRIAYKILMFFKKTFLAQSTQNTQSKGRIVSLSGRAHMKSSVSQGAKKATEDN